MVDRAHKTDAVDLLTTVKGNVTDKEKHLALKIFTHFVSTREKSYGAEIGQRIRMVEVNVWGRDGEAASGETVCEVDVTKGPQLPSTSCPFVFGRLL